MRPHSNAAQAMRQCPAPHRNHDGLAGHCDLEDPVEPDVEELVEVLPALGCMGMMRWVDLLYLGSSRQQAVQAAG